MPLSLILPRISQDEIDSVLDLIVSFRQNYLEAAENHPEMIEDLEKSNNISPLHPILSHHPQSDEAIKKALLKLTIQQPDYFKKVAQTALILNQNISTNINIDLDIYFLKLFVSKHFAPNFTSALIFLDNIEFIPIADKKIYNALLGRSYYLDYPKHLISAFERLQKLGYSTTSAIPLFYAALDSPSYSDKFEALFKTLKEAGFAYESQESFFCKAIKESYYAKDLISSFQKLQKAGFTGTVYCALYQSLLEEAMYAERLSTAFIAFKAVGFDFPQDIDLYKKIAEESYSSDKLPKAFQALQASGFQGNQHKSLYALIINKAYYADKLVLLFNRLKQAGFIGISYEFLYRKVFKHICYTKEKSAAIKSLIDANIIGVENLDIYEFVCDKKPPERFPEILSLLIDLDFSFDKQRDLLFVILEKYYYDDKYIDALRSLKNASCSFLNDAPLFLEVINHIGNATSTVMKAIIRFKQWSLKDNCFHAIVFTLLQLNSSKHTEDFISAVHLLEQDKLLYFNNGELLERLLQHPRRAYNIASVFVALNKIKTSLLTKMVYLAQSVKEPELAKMVLDKLITAGYDMERHDFLFEAFFQKLSEDVLHVNHFIKALDHIANHPQKHPLLAIKASGFSAQCQALNALFDHAFSSLTSEGPLLKQADTDAFESLLTSLVQTDITDITMTYQPAIGYEITIKDIPTVYLSLLLQHANLSHLTLTESLIAQLWEKATYLIQSHKENQSDSDSDSEDKAQEKKSIDLLDLLPPASQKALKNYTGNPYYKNINRLFRNEALVDDYRHQWLTPNYDTPNLLLNFITGVLVNDAANKLLGLSSQIEEKQRLSQLMHHLDKNLDALINDKSAYLAMLAEAQKKALIDEKIHQKLIECFNDLKILFPTHLTLDRGERLSNEIEKRRLANTLTTPSITSFSHFESGSSFFHSSDTERTTLHGDFSHYPVVNQSEGEILISHGEQIEYLRNPAGFFFASLIRSPGKVRPGTYWSSKALMVAFKDHLLKAYKDNPETISINSVLIERPNHGLAHTFRVMEAIELVTHYFAHHANDPTFQDFCQRISPHDKEWLRVAAAFSITGRESEHSAGADLARYDSYREASENHLANFLKVHPPRIEDEAMATRIKNIVRYMGNPAYERDTERHAAINTHTDLNEREHRNFLHRLLSIAHKLDLPRCYTPSKYQESMMLCRGLSVDNPKQKSDYEAMIRYQIEVIKAHGDTLQTDIDVNGELVYAQTYYQKPFDEASTSLKRVREISETISRPTLTEAYQFG